MYVLFLGKEMLLYFVLNLAGSLKEISQENIKGNVL